jgi:hypothetical protein
MTQRAPNSVRRIAVGLVVLLLAGALAAPALANTISSEAPRSYRASIDPAQACSGTEQSFTLVLRNTSTQQRLGSADITPSNGFVISSKAPTVVSPSGIGRVLAGWENGTIKLRDLAAPPRTEVRVTFSGTATGQHEFSIVAKQDNNFQGQPGNDLRLLDSGFPAVTAGHCSLEFLTQPGDAVTNQKIPGKSAQFPQVRIVSGETPVAVSGVEISMLLGPATGASGGAFTDSDTSVRTTNGVATFGNLRVDKPGFGYKLQASAAGFAPVASGAFEVGDDVDSCVEEERCTTSLDFGGSSVTASGTGGSGGGTLSLSQFAFSPAANCDEPTGVRLSRLPFAVTVGGVNLDNKQITFIVDAETRKKTTDNGVSSYQVCTEPIRPDTLEFRDRYSDALVTGSGGSGLDRGWLPDCRSGGPNAVPPTCVSSRTGTDPDGAVAITVDFGTRFRMG